MVAAVRLLRDESAFESKTEQTVEMETVKRTNNKYKNMKGEYVQPAALQKRRPSSRPISGSPNQIEENAQHVKNRSKKKNNMKRGYVQPAEVRNSRVNSQ